MRNRDHAGGSRRGRRAPDRGRESGFAIHTEGDDGIARTVRADLVGGAIGHRALFAKAIGAKSDVLDRYGLEKRWADSPFWKRRRKRTDPITA